MPRFACDLFTYLPACFIAMEELFCHLPLVEHQHQRRKQHLEALQAIGDCALGQRETVMRQLLTYAVGGTRGGRRRLGWVVARGFAGCPHCPARARGNLRVPRFPPRRGFGWFRVSALQGLFFAPSSPFRLAPGVGVGPASSSLPT